VLHAAAEAAALQDGFWPFVDRLFADRGRTDDPHLWEAASEMGFDLDRFERDRRSAQVEERVQQDFRSGVRAGVSSTPGAFVSGVAVTPPLHRALRSLCEN
jgi:protein-disulfide isomerase